MNSTGAVVPDAVVRAVNAATNTGASARTNAEGNFETPYLSSGVCRLEVGKDGLKKSSAPGSRSASPTGWRLT